MAISNYRAVLRSAVRGLWNGAIDQSQFDENMRMAISRYLTEAFNAGAKECGIKPDELTIDEQLALADIISAETSHLGDFTATIITNSKVEKGKLTPLFKRTDLWVNRYNDVKNQAKILICKDAKLEWIYGDTVHCNTCLSLHGKVKRASQWQASGIQPQNPPNDALECGGWRCACTLQATDKPVSKGPLPRFRGKKMIIMEVA